MQTCEELDRFSAVDEEVRNLLNRKSKVKELRSKVEVLLSRQMASGVKKFAQMSPHKNNY